MWCSCFWCLGMIGAGPDPSALAVGETWVRPEHSGRLGNGSPEVLNIGAWLISRRAQGFHSAAALLAMMYFCWPAIPVYLLHR